MNTARHIACLILFAIATAGCSHDAENTSAFQHISVLSGARIAVHAHGGPDAIVSADGDMSIDGKTVAVTPPQRDLLKQYFAGAIALRNDALATGAAGVATAGQAIGGVVSGLVNGKPDEIGPAVEARAAKVEARAAKVCADLSVLRSKQEAIAGQLAAFRPYATIDAGQIGDCNRGPG